MMHAIRPEMLNDETSPLAVWLIDGYQPTDAAKVYLLRLQWEQLHIQCCHMLV